MMKTGKPGLGGPGGVVGGGSGGAGVGGGQSCLAYADRSLKVPTTPTPIGQLKNNKKTLFTVTASIIQQGGATASSPRLPDALAFNGMGLANGLPPLPADGGSSGSSRDKQGQRKDFPRDITDFGLFQKRQRGGAGATGVGNIYSVSEEMGETGESDGEGRKGEAGGEEGKGLLEDGEKEKEEEEEEDGVKEEEANRGRGKEREDVEEEEEEERESFLHQESGADGVASGLSKGFGKEERLRYGREME